MRRRLAIVVTVALTVVPLACGDDDAGSTDAATDGGDPSAASTGAGSGAADLSDEGSSAEVAMSIVDSAFDPATIEAQGRAEVAVSLENTGALDHTFTVDGQDVDEELDAGATAEVVVNVPRSGTLAFYCRFHRVAGMEGSFTVADPSDPGTDATTTTAAPTGGYGY